MYERITVSDGDNNPILSYIWGKGDYGMSSPLRMPQVVQDAVKTYLGVPQESTVGWSHGFDCCVTTEPTPHVFQCRMPFHLMVGVRTGPHSTSFLPEDGMKEYPLRWFRETCYRE